MKSFVGEDYTQTFKANPLLQNIYIHQKMGATVFEKKVVLTYLFLILPIFDMLNGFLVVGGYLSPGGLASPSQLARLIATLMLLIVVYKHKLDVKWFLLLLYPIVVEIFSGFLHQNEFGFTYGIISSYKLTYLFLMCMVLSFYVKCPKDIQLFVSFFKANLLLISFTLFFSLITGLGNNTYGYGFGTKGFFASGNGIGIYMGICSLIMFGLKKYKLYINIRTSTLLFFAFATAIIGSKTALVLSLALLLLLVLNSRYKYTAIVFFIGVFLWLLPTLIEVFATVFDIVVKRYELADNFIHFIGSGRVGFVENAFQVFFEQQNITLRFIFGSGAFLSFQEPLQVNIFDTLETDLFDVLFMYGIIGASVYLFVFSRLVFILSHKAVFLLAVLLLFLHSLVAGHVIFNGLSTFVIAILSVIANYLKQNKSIKYV